MRTEYMLLLLLVATPAAARAQELTQKTLIEQTELLVNNGQLPEARELLARWRQQHARSNQEEEARFHLLTARMTTHADSAEDHYLAVAVSHPTTRSAPEALLRLAQARQARGDTRQATTYLERLVSDYPPSEQRSTGALLLARLRSTSGGNAAACSTLRGVTAGIDTELANELKQDQARYCGGRPAAVAATSPARTPANTPEAAKPEAPEPQAVKAPPPAEAAPARAAVTTAEPVARLAIQIGAFRDVNGARRVQEQLQRAGFNDARLVRVPGNALVRVRVGKFVNRSAAAPVLARLAAGDFSSVLVTDVQQEEAVR